MNVRVSDTRDGTVADLYDRVTELDATFHEVRCSALQHVAVCGCVLLCDAV